MDEEVKNEVPDSVAAKIDILRLRPNDILFVTLRSDDCDYAIEQQMIEAIKKRIVDSLKKMGLENQVQVILLGNVETDLSIVRKDENDSGTAGEA